MADDETTEHDPEQFNCDECPVLEAIYAVWPENEQAWAMFHRIACRFSADFHAAAPVLAAVMRELDAEDSLDLLDRFSVIYDVVYPPKKPGTNHGA